MTKPVNKKSPQPPAPPKERKDTPKIWLGKILGGRSILVAALGCLLLYGAISKNDGYQWVWKSLLKGNWDFIGEHRNATLDERFQMKLGFDYVFWSYIKNNTPEDAIVLFPLRKYNTEKGGDYQLSGNTNSKMWVSPFIYPRRMLYKDEQETNPLYNEVTHVAIVAGHGYDELDYPVTERTYFAVLPKKLPSQESNEQTP
jgi:hypothetical protein